MVLLEEVKLFFYYNKRNLKVLAKGLDQVQDKGSRRSGSSVNVHSLQTKDSEQEVGSYGQ